ncbi:MAG: hypothetical protein ACPGPS_16885, partial [Rubripirellula sp.]
MPGDSAVEEEPAFAGWPDSGDGPVEEGSTPELEGDPVPAVCEPPGFGGVCSGWLVVGGGVVPEPDVCPPEPLFPGFL